MKKLLLFISTISLIVSCNDYDGLQRRVDEIADRVAALEELCNTINANISALQSAVVALENMDYVTGVFPITKEGETIGYTIRFTQSEPITIYHGKDGHTPLMGTKLDTDGLYYWTVDGNWLTDEDGNKIKAVGVDGVTPILRIVDDYWCVSYDNGTTWKRLAKAVGEDGHSPVVTIQKDVDGKYYWSLDGTWMMDEQGNKIPACGVTPRMKIEDNKWYVSLDEGITWVELGTSVGDSIFSSVSVDEVNGVVTLVLNGGTSVQIPIALSNVVSKLHSLTYIPRYSDGRAPVMGVTSGSAYVELDFAISPKSVIPALQARWEKMATVKAVSTASRGVHYIDMPIRSVDVDLENGIITVCALAQNFSDSFFKNKGTAAVALHVSDGDYDLSSDYVQIYPYGVRVVAHRGYWRTAGSAENSIASLLAADAIGVWGCEFDVWQTADGVIVLHHDATIKGVMIQDATYDQIKDMTISNGEVLPTLENYLKTYKEQCRNTKLIMEFKSHSTYEKKVKVVQDAIAMVREMHLDNRVEYISFDITSCDEVVRQGANVRISILSDSSCDVAACANRGYTGIDLWCTLYQDNPTWVSDAHALGLETNSWTVNNDYRIRQAIRLGVDIVTTDYPELALSIANE